MAETYEKRARKKRKEQKRREKAARKLQEKEQPSVETEEEIAAKYLDVPDEDEQASAP